MSRHVLPTALEKAEKKNKQKYIHDHYNWIREVTTIIHWHCTTPHCWLVGWPRLETVIKKWLNWRRYEITESCKHLLKGKSSIWIHPHHFFFLNFRTESSVLLTVGFLFFFLFFCISGYAHKGPVEEKRASPRQRRGKGRVHSVDNDWLKFGICR